MTQEERIELLRQVAAVALKEMGARFYDPQGVLLFEGTKDISDLVRLTLNGDDVFDAEAIIAMLDAMEEAGWWVELAGLAEMLEGWKTGRIDRGYSVTFVENHPTFTTDEGIVVPIPFIGKTRAEAVARAFVQMFEVKGYRSVS